MNNYIIRQYKAGDEEKIIELFSIVFHQTITEDAWRWKFCRQDIVYSLVVEAIESQQIVGHVGAIPLDGLYHAQPIPCFQMCDVMIHPDVRGFLGSKNLFTQLFKEISEFIVSKHSNAFCFGFPGRRPFILGQRARAYDRVEQPVMSEFPSAYQRLRLLQLRQLQWTDKRLDKIWQQLSGQYKLIICRDKAYLNWRYASHPSFEYQLIGFYFLGVLIGWSVVQVKDDKLNMIDLLIDKKWLKPALKTLSSYASALKLKSVYLWLPKGWRDFSAEKNLSEIVATNVVWHLPMKTAEVQENFYYTMGDLDIF